MSLSIKLIHRFTSGARNRGSLYYEKKLVHLLHGSRDLVRAKVNDVESYRVLLQLEDDRIAASCSCSYFRDSATPCRHLWAAILAADASGHLATIVEEPHLQCVSSLGDDDLWAGEGEIIGGKSPVEQQGSLLDAFYAPSSAATPVPEPPRWHSQLSSVQIARPRKIQQEGMWPAKRQLIYCINAPLTMTGTSLVLSLAVREEKREGEFTAAKPLSLAYSHISRLPVAEDREILSILSGSKDYYAYSSSGGEIPEHLILSTGLARLVLPKIVRTGRCFLSLDKENNSLESLILDEGPDYRFLLQMQKGRQNSWTLSGVFRRDEERIALESPALLTDSGFFFHRGSVASVAHGASWEWITHLRKVKSIEVPATDCSEFLSVLLPKAELPELELPPELQYEVAKVDLCPRLKLTQGEGTRSDRMHAELSYRYEDQLFTEGDDARGFYHASAKRFLPRDWSAEASAVELLQELGLKPRSAENGKWELASAKLPGILHALVKREWQVEVDGKFFRPAGEVHLGVTSGIDWFELRGGVEYGDFTIQLPQLLEALRNGTNMIQLEDGSYGLLPEEWLEKIRTVAEMGASQEGHVRFRKNQAGLLDALLAAQPQISCDETFARVRDQLQRFEGIAPSDQPEGFAGQLREYQREGLGWMHFLRRFSFGGCLADDMGVGKTAQVLALLETRREQREQGEIQEPSLVVVPKSLVFNWKQEATRFAPKLRLLDYTGATRNNSEIAAHDVVLTTYGTLRRDIEQLSGVSFDYVILDEAQAIKNAGTGSAKAALLLRGSYRLAMSGTPVENHLGELWSLFEFLNPGMLGAAKVFNMADGAMRNPDEGTRKMLAYALRPFILRRTKEQVASELPEKIQQTIYCEMSSSQRELYDELREHYRNALLGRIKKDGLAKSKIQILEALLRLRQAACHPGLLDQKRLNEPSAKLDVLLDQLEEVLDEGHKALVFSQFTSLLSIVCSSLKSKGMAYEYLDGKTQDRQARVEHFQSDPDCKVFLISLKAGGVGLNLTAADYVFILDPWWNPAAEAQAIDRAHRIGQTRRVCAYRLIAKDSIEEKVLELQEAKRDLATAIIGEENSLIRDLKAEDLELLLS